MFHARRFPRLLALLLSFALAASLCGLSGNRVYAASSPFSVTVGDKSISFQKDGRTTGSYKMSRQDIVLVTDSSDDLLICFYNTDGQYVGVTLGDQSNVTLNGSIDSLVLHRDLDRNVVIGSKCSVENVTVNTPVKVSVYGDIGNVDLESAASLIAVKGSSIDTLYHRRNGGSLLQHPSRLHSDFQQRRGRHLPHRCHLHGIRGPSAGLYRGPPGQRPRLLQ